MNNRRDFLKSIGLVAASAVGQPVGALPASSKAKGPNVILIVSDEHQANTCGCYGSKVRTVEGASPTPHIDALAKEGVRFDSMYCPSPLCAPSRAAYMTGLYPHTTTALHHKMQRREAGLSRFPGVKESVKGMGTFFRDAGYKTAAIGKMHVHGEHVDGWDLGFDVRELRFYTRFPGKHYADLQEGDLNRRYREIPPYLQMKYGDIDAERFSHAPDGLTVKQNGVNEHHLETLVENEEDMFDPIVTDRSIAFIEKQTAAEQPFFIHVGLEKPHRPWTIHQRYLDRFNPDEMPLPETIAEWVEKGMFPFCQSWCHTGHTGDGARKSTAAYYGCAAQVDDCVGRIVERCRELDILENTVIVYTSDHGENLFEHGLIEKHNMLDPAARVPFVIRAPWVLPQNSVTNVPASLIDMLPTCCDLTGAKSSPDFEGTSLVPIAQGKEGGERMVFSEFYQAGSVTRTDEFLPVRMGLNDHYKYVYTQGAADQLYDREAGSEKTLTNLAFDPENEAIVSRMRLCTLDRWELDEYPQLSARALVDEGAVQLSWETAGPGAKYDIYRSADGDPYSALRLASAIDLLEYSDRSFEPGSRYTYWILGHDAITESFTDSRGKQRYGEQPILSSHYARTLPISPRIEITATPGFSRKFSYQPLLGTTFAGYSWIFIGMPPSVEREGALLEGPVSVLSPRAVGTRGKFVAEIRSTRPGYQPDHTLKLIFAYQNMHQHYLVGMHRDGTLGIWRQRSEWVQDLLISKKLHHLNPKDWHRIEVSFQDGHFIVSLDGKEQLSHIDPDPLPEGRIGFEAPLHLAKSEVRKVQWESGVFP